MLAGSGDAPSGDVGARWHHRCSLDASHRPIRVGGEARMQVQLFVAPRSAVSSEPGLFLGAALIVAYFLLSSAMVQDFRRSSPPPLVGEMTILVRSR
jgi:hypothetical protein